MINNRFINNLTIYVLLFLGYILIYVIDIEHVIYPKIETEVKSAVDFVYQQF